MDSSQKALPMATKAPYQLGWRRYARDCLTAIRALLRNPRIVLTVVATLALSIGVYAAAFAMYESEIRQPLSFDTDGTLLVLQQTRGEGGAPVGFSVPGSKDLYQNVPSLSGLAEHHSMTFTMLGAEHATRLRVGVVSHNFFQMIGVRPAAGRDFGVDDEVMGAEPVILLTHAAWLQHFGGDPAVVGTYIEMNDRRHRIIGVLPRFRQFLGADEIYMPTTSCPVRSSDAVINSRETKMLTMIGRKADGKTTGMVSAEANIVLRRQAESGADAGNADLTVSAKPAREIVSETVRPAYLALLLVSGLMVLLAIASAANLALASQARRAKEWAVQSAIGVAPGSLARSLAVEGGLSALAASLCGLLVTLVGLAWWRDSAVELGAGSFGSPSWTGLMQVCVLTTAVLMVLWSILGVQAKDSLARIRQFSDKSTASNRGTRLRKILTFIQVAVTTSILASTALLAADARNLRAQDHGFDERGVIAVQLDLNWTQYGTQSQQRDFAVLLLSRARALNPGQPVDLVGGFPLDGVQESNPQEHVTLVKRGEVASRVNDQGQTIVRRIGPQYLNVLGVKLLAGRPFSDADDERSEPVAIVNQEAAERRWGRSDVVNEQLTIDGGKTWLRIVGVVANEKRFKLDEPLRPQVYVSFRQSPSQTLALLIKTSASSTDLEREFQSLVAALDRSQAVRQVVSMAELVDAEVAKRLLLAQLFAAFSIVAIAITAVGLAGFLSHAVAIRTKEIGIRAALGFSPKAIAELFLKELLWLVGGGIVLGLFIYVTVVHVAIAYSPLGWIEESVLVLLAALLVAVAAALAVSPPIRTALSVKPSRALRTT
jgi:putative ABC transport system permease protein